MAKSDIFISYSHRDEQYKDELLRHLRVLEKQGVASFWDTSLIPAGADWANEIKNAIDEAEVAILLVSPDFLASEYVVEQELPALLERAKSRNTVVLPILVRPTQWTSVPELAQFQFLNDVRTPLSLSHQRDEDYAKISQRIADLVLANKEKRESHSRSQKEEAQQGKEGKQEDNRHVFLSHSKYDGDFAELMKLRLEKEGIPAWIDNDRLEPGVDWRQEIDESIRGSRSLIAIMSPEARESEYVTYEWAFAWGSGINLVPVMLRETPLHPRLAALQYLDFTNRRARPWDHLIKSIRNAKNSG
jgi:hypothetical protein